MPITIKEEQLLDLLEEAAEGLGAFEPYTDEIVAKIDLVLKLAGRKRADKNDHGQSQ